MTQSMKILADENIPLAAEAFATLGEVRTLPGRKITPQAVRDADALIVRSITAVNEALLAGSPVRFVATATIGVDHIDEAYLSERGIGFASAPGSNSNSVAEYVTAALLTWAERRRLPLSELTIGVVGVGHVGGKVAAKAAALGMAVLCNDPPLEKVGAPGARDFRELDELLAKADVLTFHVPLTAEGEDATAGLIGRDLLGRLRPNALVLNTSRGGVHDTAALLAARDEGAEFDLILDVWENEPNIHAELLDRCVLATPHIAGYSFDGKLAGTTMVYQAACRFFGVEPTWRLPDDLPGPMHPVIEILPQQASDQQIARQAVRHAYDIEWDDAALRGIGEQPDDQRGVYFDQLRKNYPVRREFGVGKVRLAGDHPSAARLLADLGFVMTG